jgi:hypothetical protein
MRNTLFVTIALFALFFSAEMAGAAVSPGYDPNATLTGGVRYKSFNSGNDREIYLGIPDLGVGGNRVEVDAVWQASNHIIYTYNAGAGNETTSVNTGVNVYNLTYPSVGTVNLGSLNYVQIHVANRAAGTTVDFNNVTLNGQSLGNFSASEGTTVTWMVTGSDLTSGFTIEGDILLTGAQPNGENNKVEIDVGYSVPLSIATSSLPGGTLLNPYSQTLAAAGGVLPYTWSISAGALPDGLDINPSTGEISGTPITADTFSFTAQVMDATSSTAVKNFSIVIESLPVRYGDPGMPINYQDIIQTAYDHCVDGYIIEVQALDFPGDVTCDQNVSVVLQGGYDQAFNDNPSGFTTITGTLTITNGTVVIANIIVR